jgi:hypothetical protein
MIVAKVLAKGKDIISMWCLKEAGVGNWGRFDLPATRASSLARRAGKTLDSGFRRNDAVSFSFLIISDS